MRCKHCGAPCIKKGFQKNGAQRHCCRTCGKYQQSAYAYQAYRQDTNREITSHLKEGCGIRSIGRLLGIADIRISVISHWLKSHPLRQTQLMAGHRWISSTEKLMDGNVEGLQGEVERWFTQG